MGYEKLFRCVYNIYGYRGYLVLRKPNITTANVPSRANPALRLVLRYLPRLEEEPEALSVDE